MKIQGLHHITLVCSNAQRTVDFYTQVLGQRFVKKTVNFDDPGSYHLYFGDAQGRPGSAVTFFEWPTAPRGNPGVGGTHHFALTVADYDGLLKWKRRLIDLNVPVSGPRGGHYVPSIHFNDPDGTLIEIAPREPVKASATETEGFEIKADTWPEPVPDITPDMALMQGMHHISAISADLTRTDAFYNGLLGMQHVEMPTDSVHRYWGAEDGRPGTLITYTQQDPAQAGRARMGSGQTHHFALSVPDAEAQLAWREKLIQAGLPVSPVMNRVYFKSIYTRDPDGHIVELATAGPGFAVDEEEFELGGQLKLPPWLEGQRPAIESRLRPLRVPQWQEPGDGS